MAMPLLFTATTALAHKLHKQGEAAVVAGSPLTVTPSRDWNQLSARIGKNTETWTLDGEQLNDVTFFGGIEPGKPLVKEKSKKREPLPKFTKSTLLAEVPELLPSGELVTLGLSYFLKPGDAVADAADTLTTTL